MYNIQLAETEYNHAPSTQVKEKHGQHPVHVVHIFLY